MAEDTDSQDLDSDVVFTLEDVIWRVAYGEPPDFSERPPSPSIDENQIMLNYYRDRKTYDSILLDGDDELIIEAAERLLKPPSEEKKVPKRWQYNPFGNYYLSEFLKEYEAYPKDPLHHIDPIYRPAATVDEKGLIKFDVDKMLYIHQHRNDPPEPDEAEMERNMQKVRERMKQEEEEELAKQAARRKQVDTIPENIEEELEKEYFTEFKYAKKNKLWNRKASLRRIGEKNIFA